MYGYSYKVTATTARGINYSLSNYVDSSADNGVFTFFDIIECANGNAERAAILLNGNKHIYDKWKPFRTFRNGFTLCATDYCGNKSFVTVVKGE